MNTHFTQRNSIKRIKHCDALVYTPCIHLVYTLMLCVHEQHYEKHYECNIQPPRASDLAACTCAMRLVQHLVYVWQDLVYVLRRIKHWV